MKKTSAVEPSAQISMISSSAQKMPKAEFDALKVQ
jgi:hypothetical protein